MRRVSLVCLTITVVLAISLTSISARTAMAGHSHEVPGKKACKPKQVHGKKTKVCKKIAHPSATPVPVTGPAAFGGGAFSVIDDPVGVRGTVALFISTCCGVAGYYFDSTGQKHGFLLRGGTYTTIDDPRAGRAINQGTIVTGVNVQGDVVGGYIDRSDGNHAFLLHAGAFTTLNPPGAVANARTGTIATSINAAGDIVGYYDDVGLLTHGFLLHQGTYTTLDDPLAGTLGPGTMGTTPYAIGDNGDIVGSYIDEKSVNHGFLLHAGVYTTFDHPRAGAEQYQGTTSFSFNVHGDVVGSYGDASGKWRGYLLHRGVYENFSEPNDVPSLSPSSIDDAGEIVGTFFSSGLHSFLYKPSAAN